MNEWRKLPRKKFLTVAFLSDILYTGREMFLMNNPKHLDNHRILLEIKN
jgi:hypothetical protein